MAGRSLIWCTVQFTHRETYQEGTGLLSCLSGTGRSELSQAGAGRGAGVPFQVDMSSRPSCPPQPRCSLAGQPLLMAAKGCETTHEAPGSQGTTESASCRSLRGLRGQHFLLSLSTLMGGKRIDCTPTPAMWIGLQPMVSPSSKAAYAIGFEEPKCVDACPRRIARPGGLLPKDSRILPCFRQGKQAGGCRMVATGQVRMAVQTLRVSPENRRCTLRNTHKFVQDGWLDPEINPTRFIK